MVLCGSVLTVMDCNNFWSATGGGVRRYTLEKIRAFAQRDDVRYVFVMPDSHDEREQVARNVVIEHVRAPAPPRTGGEYRMIARPAVLRRLLACHRPDVVEVGSWYYLPQLVRWVCRELPARPALVGFWHADFPRAYVGRTMARIHPVLERPCEAIGWWWARRGYGLLDGVFVASKWVADNLMRHGVDRLFHTPLGVDLERFHPRYRDDLLVERFRAGDHRRPVILFAHRFQEEKGVRTLLAAYPDLVRRRVARGLPAPALVFAGTGFDQARVEEAARRYRHVHYVGYLSGREHMSRWLASSDLFLALSPFETFGLSLVEAMASGTAVVGADQGSAGELITGAGCGATVPYADAGALARAMDETLSAADSRDLGARGRAHVSTMTWDNTFATELAFYRRIAADVRAGGRPEPGIHQLPVPSTVAELGAGERVAR